MAEKEDKKEKKKNKKKEADPNGLKRPLSAYMLYNNFRRPTLKEADPSKFLPQLFENQCISVFANKKL